MADEKTYVNPITPEKKQEIINNSVMASPNSVVGNPTELKKTFVKPIVNNDGTPCVADEIDRVAKEANEALHDHVKKSGDIMTGSLTVGYIGEGENADKTRAVRLSTDSFALEVLDGENITEYNHGYIREKYMGKERLWLFPAVNGVLAVDRDLTALRDSLREEMGELDYADQIILSINPQTYELTATLNNRAGEVLSTNTIDLPLETMVVNGRFDDETDSVILTLQNGNEIKFSVAQLVAGLINGTEFQAFLATKGQPNGFAGLDENGKVPKEQLPASSGGGGIDEEALKDYVKFTDYASTTQAGVVKVDVQRGVDIDISNRLYTVYAKNADILEKTNHYRPIVPYTIDYTVKVGITTNTQTLTDEEKTSACDWLGALTKSGLNEIYEILDLAGITETVETTSTYDVRDTAEVGNTSLFVLPDTPTMVTKVEGNSVVAENLLDVTKLLIASNMYVDRVVVKNNGADVYIYGNTTISPSLTNVGKFSDLIPTAKIGDVLYFGLTNISNNAIASGYPNVLLGNGSYVDIYSGDPVTVTKEILDNAIAITLSIREDAPTLLHRFFVTKNNRSWTNYFTGLKPAIFNGIVSGGKNLWNNITDKWIVGTNYIKTSLIPLISDTLRVSIEGIEWTDALDNIGLGSRIYLYDKNLVEIGYVGVGAAIKIAREEHPDAMYFSLWHGYDGASELADFTKTQIEIGNTITAYEPYVTPSELVFSEIEMPLGRALDFENKKVFDYGVDIVLDGSESWEYYTAVNRNGVRLRDYSQTDENYATVICTDAGQATATRERNTIGVGQNNGVLYWYGALDALGYTTEGVTPTTQEQTAAVANFKAWLTQRYESGNPVVIRYKSAESRSERDMTEEEIAAGNTYMPIAGGIEYQKGNSSAVYGANSTVTQEYDMYRKLGGDE